MNKRIFVASLAALMVFASGCTTTGRVRATRPRVGRPSTRPSTTRSPTCTGRSRARATSSSRAKAVLVFPAVLEAGFIVGASRGDGALRVGGKTVSFHRTTARLHRPAGRRPVHGHVRAVHDRTTRCANFPEQPRLDGGRGRVGHDDLTVGASAQMTTATAQQPVIGYVLSNSGLMAGVTIDGARVTTLNL